MSDYRDLREMLLDACERFETCTAFHEKKQGFYQHVSYGKLREEIEALGTALSARLPEGARVMLVGKGSYHRALAFLSLLCGVGVCVPADDALTAEELAVLAEGAAVDAVLFAPEAGEKVAALGVQAAICLDEIPALIALGREKVLTGDWHFIEREIDPSDPAVLFDAAKAAGGVLLSQANMLAAVLAVGRAQHITELDIFLSVLSPAHVYECVLGLLLPLSCGASVAFAEGVGCMMRNMREIHPTCMVTVPYLAERIYQKFFDMAAQSGTEEKVRRTVAATDAVRPLAVRQALKARLLATARVPFGGALDRMIVVGGLLSPAVSRGLRRIGIFAAQVYGVAACAGVVAMATPGAYRDGTVGKPLFDTEVEIIDPQADGSGELRVRGAQVMQGYNRHTTATTAALWEGWYHTGDLARIDADGFLEIIGRCQNCITRSSGARVAPEELETLLKQSPLVLDAAVVGVVDDRGVDSEPTALILPDREAAAELLGEDFAEQDLETVISEWIEEINETRPDTHRIALFALRDAPLPRTVGGRLARKALARELADAKQMLS